MVKLLERYGDPEEVLKTYEEDHQKYLEELAKKDEEYSKNQ